VKLEVLNTSVVVLAQHHNPTILHPSFLTSQNIISNDWELAELPVSTPVFAMVKYKNGIVFNVEESKFQVIDNKIPDDIKNSMVAGLAFKYIEKLPHVCYTAVGINFNGFISCSNPEAILMDMFLTPGSGDYDGCQPDAFGLRLIYNLPDSRLRLQCDIGKVKHGNQKSERKGLLVDANYHMNLKENHTLEDISRATSFHSKYGTHFTKMIKSVFNLED